MLLLIPNIGTRNTFFAFSFVLLAISLIGLFWSLRARALPYVLMPAVLALLMVAFPPGIIKPTTEGQLIYETESQYNYIQVVQWDDERWLKLNEGQGVHSVYVPNSVLVGGIWDYFLIAPFFNKPPYSADQVGILALIGSPGSSPGPTQTLISAASLAVRLAVNSGGARRDRGGGSPAGRDPQLPGCHPLRAFSSGPHAEV